MLLAQAPRGTLHLIFLPCLLHYLPRLSPCCFSQDTLMQQRALALFALVVMLATSGTSTFTSASAQAQYQSAPSSRPSSGDYVLGPNDRVRLKVYGEPDISGEYEIDN